MAVSVSDVYPAPRSSPPWSPAWLFTSNSRFPRRCNESARTSACGLPFPSRFGREAILSFFLFRARRVFAIARSISRSTRAKARTRISSSIERDCFGRTRSRCGCRLVYTQHSSVENEKNRAGHRTRETGKRKREREGHG
ncbi:hypothetical protein PUN28_014437 [Cardiocondyla obscurior]|uniref:Uncharacterized protein n=1 Tax=Cardiocondyla obscurior TaxID=286306 RepID=A0AAW2F605_9HYME